MRGAGCTPVRQVYEYRCFLCFTLMVKPCFASPTFELDRDISGFTSTTGQTGTFGAGKGSIFTVDESTANSATWRVRFSKPQPYKLSPPPGTTINQVNSNDIYSFNNSGLSENFDYHLVRAFVAGVLAVPFKYQFSGHTFTSGGTLGPYVGVKTDRIAEGTTFLVSAGLAVVPTEDISSKSVKTAAGFSVAGGVVIQPLRNVQLGLIVGTDILSGSDAANYSYNGKLWGSLAVGFSFIQ